MKDTPKRDNFSQLVVRPINNGYLVEIETETEDLSHAFKTYRQVLQFLKTVETITKVEE